MKVGKKSLNSSPASSLSSLEGAFHGARGIDVSSAACTRTMRLTSVTTCRLARAGSSMLPWEL